MSGDVQPRKRKDKKRKKDELGLEEHRGTAATFGEGDVQMHSQHDHGTGGHWCAKIIFFSLLAVLVTLMGLIILENRGLTELEANAVESQYSGILDGWIEDTPDDDHHDEHTLDLKHHEHDEDEHELENDQEFEDDDDHEDVGHDEDDDDDHEDVGHDEGDDDDEELDNDDEEDGESNEVDENDDEDVSKEVDDDEGQDEADEENDNDNEDEDDEEIEEQDIKSTESRYAERDDDEDNDGDDEEDYDGTDDDNVHDKFGDLEDDNDDDEGDTKDRDNTDDISNEIANDDDDKDNEKHVEDDDDNEPDNDDDDEQDNDDVDDQNSDEDQDDEDDEEHEEDHEEEAEEEIEKIEKEVSDQEVLESAEVALPGDSAEKEEETSVEVVIPDEEYEVDEKAFLEIDDIEEPAVERIAPPPPGKPFAEIEDEASTEVPPDTLAEEEEYEKLQEELRQQEAQSTQMWLKLAVGGALLAATHAVIRRVTAPRDIPGNEQDEHASREETPLSDRRMTLIPEQSSNVIPAQSFQPKVEEEIVQRVSSVVKASPIQKQESEEVDEDVADDEVEEDQEVQETKNLAKDKELYSDDEDEADEEVEEEEELEEKKEAPKPILKAPVKKQPEPEPEDDPDDVEIIDDDQIDEEVEEEVEDEEELSDVNDDELMSRLEAKYGRLPEPERPGQRHKDGGNSLEDEWPGEPSEPFWREQLEKAEQELRQGSFVACAERASAARLAGSGRARWLRASALDRLAEARRDNRELARAITAYMQLLEMNERLSDKKLLKVASRTIDRIQFRGTYLNAEPVYRLLIRRFPNDVTYRNNLTISFLMANRADLASEVLKETLRLWPSDRVALAHYGFVLKTEHNKLEEAVTYFQKALEGDAGPANEPRFYYHLGDALLMLGRKDEAHEVHKRGAELGHFLSPSQRSLYNVPRLKSQPWWDVETTPYAKLARELEKSWREILKEGEAAAALYEKEKEGLRERGEWSQLDLFVRGREVPGRCARAPVTCGIVKAEPAAQCRRGQVKFSLMSGGSHVRAHVGPTNCRLRMHLALSNTDRTYLRVDQETRQWQVGKVLMFDDSFEHEVWHNGTLPRLVLIVDVWHPALSPRERASLPAI